MILDDIRAALDSRPPPHGQRAALLLGKSAKRAIIAQVQRQDSRLVYELREGEIRSVFGVQSAETDKFDGWALYHRSSTGQMIEAK